MSRDSAVIDTETRREGARWIGERPGGEDVALWFSAAVGQLPEGMDIAAYVGGVVLITGTEKRQELNEDGTGFVEVSRLVHTAYVKVETRVAFFWDWCDALGYVGEIVPVDMPRLKDAGVANDNMPPGFFRQPVVDENGKATHFVCCSMKVNVYSGSGKLGAKVRNPPPATKQIAMLGRWGPDPFSLMKAETGAIGRALGMAGMLVVPGSGIATAEDVLEIPTAGGRAAGDVVAPPADPGGAEIPGTTAPERIATLIVRLQSEAPDKYEELAAWAAERDIDLDHPKDTQTRALLRAAEKKIEDAGLA